MGARLMYAAAILLIGAKWLLISQNEIVSEPHDAHQYVLISENVSAGGGGKSIGYPLWLSITRLSGMPQRLVIEGLWVLSSMLFATLLARISGRRWVLPVALAILLFTPATFFLFDRALTEGFYICLTLLLAAASLVLLNSRGTFGNLAASLGSGGAAGFMLISRNETSLMIVYFAILVVAWTFLQRTYHSQTWRTIGPRLLVVILTITMTTSLPYGLAALQNKRRNGVFTVNLAEMPSHMGMLKRLAAINTAQEGIRFIPISRAAREMAYAVSPGLARFKPFVEDPTNIYQKVTQESYGTTGEIGAGWIWHVFNQTAPALGATSSAAVHTLYSQINRELDDAFSDGRLGKRFVPHPFLGANTMMWIKHLPEGLIYSLRCVILPTQPTMDQDYASELFDRACLRRQSLVPRSLFQLKGWAFAHGTGGPSTISRLFLNFTDGTTREIRLVDLPRPDVRTGFAPQGIEGPINAGFEATATAGSHLANLTFVTENGTQGAWEQPVAGKAVSLRSLENNTKIEAGLDMLKISRPAWSEGIRSSLFNALMQVGASTTAWSIALLATLVALATRILTPIKLRITPLFIGSLLFLAWSAGRVIFYAIITAGAWQAESRYLQPATVLTLCAMLTALAFVAESKTANYRASLQ